jgi:hypothetical protein
MAESLCPLGKRRSDHVVRGRGVVKLRLEQSGSWIGIAGMAVTGFLYGYSAFVVRDVLSILVLPAFWLLLFVLACRWFLTQPYRVLLLPVIAVVVWFTAMLT